MSSKPARSGIRRVLDRQAERRAAVWLRYYMLTRGDALKSRIDAGAELFREEQRMRRGMQ